MTCDKCKKENNEVAVFHKRILLGLFNIKVQVCQSCISKVFKQFTKGV